MEFKSLIFKTALPRKDRGIDSPLREISHATIESARAGGVKLADALDAMAFIIERRHFVDLERWIKGDDGKWGREDA